MKRNVSSSSKNSSTSGVYQYRTMFARIAGVALLGVFALNLYIALYDQNLSQFSPLHYYLNWFIVGATLLGSVLLFLKPASRLWVGLAGVVWPIAYVVGLVADVSSRLCLGTGTNCWPDTNTAFQYLIVNNPNIPSGYGWTLWPYTVPSALALVSVALVLSVISLVLGMRRKNKVGQKNQSPTLEFDGAARIRLLRKGLKFEVRRIFFLPIR